LLPTVRSFIEAVCQSAGLDEQTTDDIVLAANEAANNAIRHAHQENPQAQLQVQCSLGQDWIEIQLLDEGEPFDLESVAPCDPSELRVGGRGLFLMRALMDEVSCRPRGQRGNTVRLVKRCEPNSAKRDAG